MFMWLSHGYGSWVDLPTDLKFMTDHQKWKGKDLKKNNI